MLLVKISKKTRFGFQNSRPEWRIYRIYEVNIQGIGVS